MHPQHRCYTKTPLTQAPLFGDRRLTSTKSHHPEAGGTNRKSRIQTTFPIQRRIAPLYSPLYTSRLSLYQYIKAKWSCSAVPSVSRACGVHRLRSAEEGRSTGKTAGGKSGNGMRVTDLSIFERCICGDTQKQVSRRNSVGSIGARTDSKRERGTE